MVPASYFPKTVSKCNLVPDILRTECGNQNCITAGMQCKLANHTDTHGYGSSLSLIKEF